MFARMTILQVQPDSSESAIRVVPEARKQKGYRGACLLTDRGSGKAIAVTFWRGEKDALANEASRFYQEQLVKFLQYFSGPPIREGYTVSVHAMAVPDRKRRRTAAGRRVDCAPPLRYNRPGK
jgi:heme-degrading monooxygenase HmoA